MPDIDLLAARLENFPTGLCQRQLKRIGYDQPPAQYPLSIVVSSRNRTIDIRLDGNRKASYMRLVIVGSSMSGYPAYGFLGALANAISILSKIFSRISIRVGYAALS